MYLVPPRKSWQIPLASDALVAGALARGRAVALTALAPRIDGLPDSDVTARHEQLHAAVVALADHEEQVLERLDELELQPADAAWTRWQTPLALVDADDDASVVELALDVWDALGPSTYRSEYPFRPPSRGGWHRTLLAVSLYAFIVLGGGIGWLSARLFGMPVDHGLGVGALVACALVFVAVTSFMVGRFFSRRLADWWIRYDDWIQGWTR